MEDFTRVAIIDHDNHALYIEDISESDLEKYNGEEEYIKNNFTLGENWEWDYIIDATYFSKENKDGIDIDFEKL